MEKIVSFVHIVAEAWLLLIEKKKVIGKIMDLLLNFLARKKKIQKIKKVIALPGKSQG
jgi:hypothetical protein